MELVYYLDSVISVLSWVDVEDLIPIAHVSKLLNNISNSQLLLGPFAKEISCPKVDNLKSLFEWYDLHCASQSRRFQTRDKAVYLALKEGKPKLVRLHSKDYYPLNWNILSQAIASSGDLSLVKAYGRNYRVNAICFEVVPSNASHEFLEYHLGQISPRDLPGFNPKLMLESGLRSQRPSVLRRVLAWLNTHYLKEDFISANIWNILAGFDSELGTKLMSELPGLSLNPNAYACGLVNDLGRLKSWLDQDFDWNYREIANAAVVNSESLAWILTRSPIDLYQLMEHITERGTVKSYQLLEPQMFIFSSSHLAKAFLAGNFELASYLIGITELDPDMFIEILKSVALRADLAMFRLLPYVNHELKSGLKAVMMGTSLDIVNEYYEVYNQPGNRLDDLFCSSLFKSICKTPNNYHVVDYYRRWC